MFASHVCNARFCSVMKKVRYGDQACNLESKSNKSECIYSVFFEL